MGLTKNSTGTGARYERLDFVKRDGDKVIALMGNPNVGKSTLFNALTGLKQHTGNWPGKTVTGACGRCRHKNADYILVDLPGTYSLSAHSAEEEVARDFLCFSHPDAVIVVCDATCLERNLILVLQTMSIADNVTVALNLMDEAKRRGVEVDIKKLQNILNVPVVPTSARSNRGIYEVMDKVSKLCAENDQNPYIPKFSDKIENAVCSLEPLLGTIPVKSHFLASHILSDDCDFITAVERNTNAKIKNNEKIRSAVKTIKANLLTNSIPSQKVSEDILSAYVKSAQSIADECVTRTEKVDINQKIDKILTGKWTGIPIMLLLLGGIFWITITGANYPSEVISSFLFWIEDKLHGFFSFLGAPWWLSGILIDGMYRTLAWVVSVMLPPMAIFFPLFTLLEDFGYLPRVAFHLDHSFQKAGACGKQALTTCMGFGCNAVGVVGCRIIDSPRERLIAMITNAFVPCNGRFPTLIAIITMFFAGVFSNTFVQNLFSATILLAVIVLGVCMTFLASKILSHTILKGVPSSFTLELPPYRRPQIGKVIVRSIFDRTLFVLARAVTVAAPAGIILWLLSNVQIGTACILTHISDFLNPVASLFGMDGVILLAFILSFPANEILLPIILMCYLNCGSLTDYDNLFTLKSILVSNGWTVTTAICVVLFSLMHWPCSTTCLTIKKESQSLKWTVVSFIVPAVFGLLSCFLVSSASKLIGLL